MLCSARCGDQLIVQLNGELDHYSAQSIRRDLDTMLSDPGIKRLILDFSRLTFMDSSGIGVILGRYRIMRDRGGMLYVSRMNTHIARIFHMSGMERVIKQIELPLEVIGQ